MEMSYALLHFSVWSMFGAWRMESQRPQLHTFTRSIEFILSHCTPYQVLICHASDIMAYIYATALTGDIVKLGRSENHKDRALAAQSYHVDKVRVIGFWQVDNGHTSELAAHRACLRWHVRGELYRVSVDWLDIAHPLVARVSGILGPTMPRVDWPEYRSPRGTRKPWETKQTYRMRMNRT